VCILALPSTEDHGFPSRTPSRGTTNVYAYALIPNPVPLPNVVDLQAKLKRWFVAVVNDAIVRVVEP